jgi:large subunit ribosomal protein L19
MNVVDSFRQENLRKDLPDFNIGDTVVLSVRIQEGGKSRVQNFEGVVMARRGTGLEASVTVRKISSGIAVERIYPLQSPNLASVKIVKRGRVRRAKLYYLRGRTGRKARIREAPRRTE